MAKMVGYACNVKLSWLNYTVSLLDENLTEPEFKEKLNEYLSFEIDGPTRLRKTREILMNIWFYERDDIASVRAEAKTLLQRFPECDIAIHLCMIYLTYPVFADVCKFMGRLFDFQDVITNTVLRQKLYDEWGERGSLESTTRRITLTLKDMGILSNEARTRYRLTKHNVTAGPVIDFMIFTAMKIDGSGYYPFVNLTDLNVLFPFTYQVTKEQFMQNKKFLTSNFGGEFSVSLSE
jgi:hypothetical protein